MKNLKKYFKGFTLVELIIVITILAILATIAFVSFQSYTKDARDANRTATIKNIEKGLELFTIKTGNFPTPDEPTPFTGGLDGKVKINQGIVGDGVATIINMNTTPLDPNDKSKYTYSTFGDDNKYYQIAINAENRETSFISQALAFTPKSAIVQGNYSFDPSLPSLIVVPSSVNTASGIFDPKVCFVIDGGQNSLSSSSGSCIEKEEMSLKEFDNSLVGYWDMETCTGSGGICGTGDKLKDLSGNKNDGVFSGSILPTSTGGILGKGYKGGYFDINDYSIKGLKIDKEASFGFIVKGYNGTILGKRTQDNKTDYQIFFETGVNPNNIGTINNRYIRFHGTTEDAIWIQKVTSKEFLLEDSTISFDNNRSFYNGVITFYNGDVKIYINGIEINSLSYQESGSIYSNILSTNSGSLQIGARKGENLFNGIIDDVKIYNRALTDEEIKQQAKIAGF